MQERTVGCRAKPPQERPEDGKKAEEHMVERIEGRGGRREARQEGPAV
jgi:hypothetical protein